MNNIVIFALGGLGATTLILGLLIWNYEQAQRKAAQERAENRELIRRIEAGKELYENSHSNEWK
jgi:cell division protein FtsB